MISSLGMAIAAHNLKSRSVSLNGGWLRIYLQGSHGLYPTIRALSNVVDVVPNNILFTDRSRKRCFIAKNGISWLYKLLRILSPQMADRYPASCMTMFTLQNA
jgi:hypothetical protein